MSSRFSQFVKRLSAGLWFIPGLLTLLSVALAAGMLWLDTDFSLSEWAEGNPLLFSGTEGASRLLGTIAGSVISVAGVLFSITILVLSMASAQFGPRLLQNFMQHRGTQVVLGAFVGTFTYCLLVLRFIGVNEEFVPHIAVNVGLLFGLISFFLLIYFIHHVATFIRVANVIDDVAVNMERTLQVFFPERCAGSSSDPDGEMHSEVVKDIDANCTIVRVKESGYLQLVEYDKLLKTASAKNVTIRLYNRPGQYLLNGARLAGISPPERADDELAQCQHTFMVTGVERTMDQDAEFAVNQLVEIALRALSPGVNDPTTAVQALDALHDLLRRLATRHLPTGAFTDSAGRPRLHLPPPRFEDYLDLALHEADQYGADSRQVQ
ncbi:MAG: DUF2254 domain-containing protein, partial [Proteobacteria bacterium]|nr:DUF2254 domain-containing protein [Pseudomonadota bacterium]